jgi:hypothetical protein
LFWIIHLLISYCSFLPPPSMFTPTVSDQQFHAVTTVTVPPITDTPPNCTASHSTPTRTVLYTSISQICMSPFRTKPGEPNPLHL